MSKQKINRFVGSIGAFIGFLVFIAYIPQIIANLQGTKGQPFQPLFAAVSCLIWVIYGWTKEPKKTGYLFSLMQLESFWADLLFLPLYSKKCILIVN